MAKFEIDADVRKAWTMPSGFYSDDRYFHRSREKIFARCWQFLCRTNEFEGLKPITLLPDFLDEPIFLSKSEGAVHCLSNVCTHRGNILVEEECLGSLVRCRYHGRRFSLDGKFLSMPEFDDVENFPGDSDDLHQYALAERAGFIFVSIDPAADLDDFIGSARDELIRLKAADLKLAETREYYVNAHWALYCENYLEGFHIPYVHKTLNQTVDYASYSTELFRYSSLQTGFDESGNVVGQYLFIFPNTMLNFYPWGLSLNIVEPLASDKTRVRYFTYVSDETKRGVGAGADLHRVELEDEAIVANVQRGIRSRFYDRGRYSPTRETGTHHFHRLLAEFLG